MMIVVIVVRATRKLLSRLSAPPATEEDTSTTLLGDWYANVLTWRPRQVALFVSETTLLPVLMPLAPSATLLDRFPNHLEAVLRRHGVEESLIALECSGSLDHRVSTTRSRSVVGSMKDFGFLADVHRDQQQDPDLLAISVGLARVPCGPLFKRHVSPDRELRAVMRSSADGG